MLLFGFRIFCWYRGFCHRTGSDLLLFLLITDFKVSNIPRYLYFTLSCYRIKRVVVSAPCVLVDNAKTLKWQWFHNIGEGS